MFRFRGRFQKAASNRGVRQRDTVFHRRLSLEHLEARSLLSTVSTSAAAPQQGLADLPLAQQLAISTTIGRDQAAYHGASDALGVSMSNVAHDFSARFQSNTFSVSTGPDTWSMSLVAYGYGDDLQPVGASQTTVNGNRVDRNYGAINEWYINGPSGLEQGFDVSLQRPANADGLLTVELALGGNLHGVVNEAKDAIALTGLGGSGVLSYGGLVAYDAAGKTLPSWLEVRADSAGQDLLIHVDDTGAQGRITIDPLVQTAKLTASNGASGDAFGLAVAISGNTVVVGAMYASVDVVSNRGMAYVFTLDDAAPANMNETARLSPSDGNADAHFGRSVSISGNTIVVGAAGTTIGGNLNQGAAYVFMMPASGWTSMTETAKLTASDGTAWDGFGRSVAISGRTVVATAIATIGQNVGQGAVYVFTEPNSGWKNMTQSAKLTASDGTARSSFGQSVAISDDTVVVGDNGTIVEDRYVLPAAYVFVQPFSGWINMTETARLTPSDNVPYDGFGGAVAISDDTVVVGADGVGGTNVLKGAAYVFVRPSSGWVGMTETARLTASDSAPYDGFGNSVAISDDTVVVGAVGKTIDGHEFQGAAYVFKKPIGRWADTTEFAKLTASDGHAIDEFGSSLAVAGNTVVMGCFYAAIGANARQGAAYLFELADSNAASVVQRAKLVASDGAAGRQFGSDVAISGNLVAVTAPCTTIDDPTFQGAAYLYAYSSPGSKSMTQVAKLTASDRVAYSFFGGSIAICGDTVVVGAYDAPVGNNVGQGAVYVFTMPATGWKDMTETAKLTASDGQGSDIFGYSVAISGRTIVVGASFATVGDNFRQGSAYVFKEPDTGWASMTETAKLTASDGSESDRFGDSVSISGNTLVIGTSTVRHGSAYVFTKPGDGWTNMTQTAKLTATDGGARNFFGHTVSISGDTVAVGAYFQTVGANERQGAVYVYTKPRTGWADMTETVKFTVADGDAKDGFGSSVALDGNTLAIGAFGVNHRQGAGYLFTASASGWGGATQTAKFSAIDAAPEDYFGHPISLSGNLVVVGMAAATIGTNTYEGAAYVFEIHTATSAMSDGFESGGFNTHPWDLTSSDVSQNNWQIETSTVHSGSFAAQSGAIGPSSSCTMSVTLTVEAGELSFWRKVSSAQGQGLLIFSIDGVPQTQWSGEVPWQQSFYGITAGTHTFSWVFAKLAGPAGGSDAAWIDDILFTPGTTLTVEGTPGSDTFSFDASGPAITLALNGEIHSFAPGQFTRFVFHGNGGGDAAYLATGAGADQARFQADGSAQIENAAAGYTVDLDGLSLVRAFGQAEDSAEFFDSPGYDFFYGFADADGRTLAGMYNSGRTNAASGFGKSAGHSSQGGDDMAAFWDGGGDDVFYAYASYDGRPVSGMYAGGYANAATGFATNVAFSLQDGCDTAVFFDSPGDDTFYAYAGWYGTRLAGMYGPGYANSATGFETSIAYSTEGGLDTAGFFDTAGDDSYYAYAAYNGEPLAGMYGGGYTNSASGFALNLGFSSRGGFDTAVFFDSPGDDVIFAYPSPNGLFTCGIYGDGYYNQADGFLSNVVNLSTGNDRLRLAGSSDPRTIYTDLAIAQLFGGNAGLRSKGLNVLTSFGLPEQGPVSLLLRFSA